MNEERNQYIGPYAASELAEYTMAIHGLTAAMSAAFNYMDEQDALKFLSVR